MLIGIAGMVGSGKSTLTRALAARFGLQHALESVDEHNPWLERFYAGGVEAMRATALNLQLHFLATRFESMRRMRGAGGSWVLDRTWYEDAEIFARGHYDEGLMSELEWELYRRLNVERIRARGRAKERETPDEYWASLHARYERWITRFRACPVLSLDVREYDLVADAAAIEAIAARVRARLEPELPQTELFPGALRARPEPSGVTV